MTVLDDKLPGKVFDLIEKYGVDASFLSITSRSHSTATGDVTTSTSAVTRKISPPSPFEASFGITEPTPRERIRFVVAAQGLTFTVQKGMKLDYPATGGKRYQITSVGTVPSGASNAAFEVEAVL